MVLTKLIMNRNVIAIGSCTLIALVFVAWVVYVNYFAPKPVAPVLAPTPAVTVTDYYYFLENPEDYYAGKCAIVSESAAPDFYAAHPGMVQCKFKNLTKEAGK